MRSSVTVDLSPPRFGLSVVRMPVLAVGRKEPRSSSFKVWSWFHFFVFVCLDERV